MEVLSLVFFGKPCRPARLDMPCKQRGLLASAGNIYPSTGSDWQPEYRGRFSLDRFGAEIEPAERVLSELVLSGLSCSRLPYG